MGNVKTLEKITKALVNGDLNKLSLEDSFVFSCKKCGRCCVNTTIIVSSYDVIRMRHSLGMSTTTMVKEGFLHFNIGPNSKMPIASIQFRETDDLEICPFTAPAFMATFEDAERLASGEGDPFDLPIAANDYGDDLCMCGVHKDRPLRCRMYPIGRVFSNYPGIADIDSAEVTWFLIDLPSFCNGTLDTSECTLHEWIQDQELQEHLDRSKECMTIMARLVDSKILGVEGELGERAVNMAFSTLYDFDSLLAKLEGNRTWKDYSDDEIMDFIGVGIDTLISIAEYRGVAPNASGKS